ncbi:hypothetical protein L228DRAFT_236659 [Xylona heveae TC161]|uniref:CENP-V/GFA domain-containing protein n=1 Tax=Xylona heveae (strain CBS 132557 / TC161) TaxID=1328760 RepID=A0A165IZC6_XYLHT|nr:hypothetical protein L228DRAFT_236659 [Xylona heveae TC161]KZF25581.1 hypothetical protein L228DRAFT_236659 [Xylona heveae TC161]
MSSTAETVPKPRPRPEYITGGCLCGSVRYKVKFGEGTPWPPRMILSCQCTQCRKATGALVAHIISFYDSQIEWTANSESSHYMRTTTFPTHPRRPGQKPSAAVGERSEHMHAEPVKKQLDTSEVTDIHKTPGAPPTLSSSSSTTSGAANGDAKKGVLPARDQFEDEVQEDERDFPQFIDAFTDQETHIHANESALKEFRSSSGVSRTFCAQCGSTLTWRKDEQENIDSESGENRDYGNKAYNLDGRKLAPETEIMAGSIDRECLVGFIDEETGQGSGKRHDPERKGLGIKLGQELCRPVNGNDWFRYAIPGITDRVVAGKVNMGFHEED